jgi:response regulator NasT
MNYSAPTWDSKFELGRLSRSHDWRVVLAEDEVLPAELLKRMLTRLGYTVVGSARNGVEAIDLVRAQRPDIVLMDLRMPVMDGWTAMAELEKDWIAPIVVISALDDTESLEQAVNAGASGFLTKPVREDDLERALELAVARFADLQEIRKWRADAEARAEAQQLQAEALARALGELREAQLQLVTAARRAAMASLARSLTHEINNALTPIIGYAQMLQLLHEGDAETVERLQQIVEHARRIATWTAAFRQLSVGARRERILFSLNDVVQDVLQLYAERFARLGIVVAVDLDQNMPMVDGFPDQMRELLINLIQNSVEAMRSGGMLFVQSRFGEPGTVHLTITDSGSGIAAADLPHVTEPGFSTKRLSGDDTSFGWGLFTASQIVKSQQGVLEIQSPPEQGAVGTTVWLRLPLNPGSEGNILGESETI